nr:alpha-L-fucosidase 1 [Ipomoea trifida]
MSQFQEDQKQHSRSSNVVLGKMIVDTVVAKHHRTIERNNLVILIHLLYLLSQSTPSFGANPKPPPIPLLPIPSARQLSWQLSEMAMFLHFGPNTFTGSEWGSGHADPSIFNPDSLNATQWVSVAKENGFTRLVLTAKHHDGFCLWPSLYTNYSVKSSPWRNGLGDVLGDLAQAAKAAGLQLGVYLSPWDKHEPVYGNTVGYNEFYLGQMTELLTGYGEIKEVFLDGAKGEGEKDMEYYFDDWFDLIHQLQPAAAIFTDAGPDTRWIGDEDGVAGTTCWSLINSSDVTIGGTDYEYIEMGDPSGQDWVPAECDVSIRPGWFWHASEAPKTAMDLLDLYYKSVGRNCQLLLNVPPNTSGLISDEDIQVLREFTKLRTSIFSRNLAKSARFSASSTRGTSDFRFAPYNVIKEGIYTYWAPGREQSEFILYLDFQEQVTFNVLEVQEPIHMGQRIIAFHLDVLNEFGEWQELIDGTTVGYRRLLLFPVVKTYSIRLVIDECRDEPLVSYLGLYMDPYSNLEHKSSSWFGSLHFNGSRVLRDWLSAFM